VCRIGLNLLCGANLQVCAHPSAGADESPDRIVWESRNRCPLLEACAALGLDTRAVCRPVNEQATQAFFSRLDPRLRFGRSYVEIRPHAACCREWITREAG